eukprot:213604-Chlamydomonas_euryale.AAC.26
MGADLVHSCKAGHLQHTTHCIAAFFACTLPQSHRQKKRRPHDICRMGASYLADTKKSQMPRKPSVASMVIALSTAAWKGGITAHCHAVLGGRLVRGLAGAVACKVHEEAT